MAEDYRRDVLHLDYRQDVKIDVSHFDLEWLRQSDLTCQYGDAEAEENRRVAEAERALGVAKATAYKEAHERVKSPADRVKAEAETDSKYLKALDEYNAAMYRRNLVSSAYKAIRRKRNNMENYLKGQLSGLWGQPIEPRSEGKSYGQEVVESTRSQATEASREAASRRRTRTA